MRRIEASGSKAVVAALLLGLAGCDSGGPGEGMPTDLTPGVDPNLMKVDMKSRSVAPSAAPRGRKLRGPRPRPLRPRTDTSGSADRAYRLGQAASLDSGRARLAPSRQWHLARQEARPPAIEKSH